MSHEYVYIFDGVNPPHDKFGVLPLYGVACSDFLQIDSTKNGNFTGTIRLDTRGYTPQRILDMTVPGKTRIWVERDQQLVWGGLLWSRTYQSDGRSLQLSGQTFTSYLAAVAGRFTNEEAGFTVAQAFQTSAIIHVWPYNSIRQAWHKILQVTTSFVRPRYQIGVVLEPYHADNEVAASGNTGNYTFNEPTSRKYYQASVDDLLKRDAEYRIRIFYDGVGTRTAQFEAHARGRLGITASVADQFTVLRYPGVISKYWMTDSAATAATEVIGTGQAGLQGFSVNAAYSNYGSPSPLPFMGLDLIKSYATDDMPTMQASMDSDVQDLAPPIIKPVYELSGDDLPFDFQLGDRRRIVIDDPYRYPDGPVGGVARIVGWQLTPESGDNVERIALTVDDTSGLVTL